jgi:outer membrane cobalamin receptor
LIRRPRHSVGVDALWHRGAGTAGVGMIAVIDRVDTDFNEYPYRTVDPGSYADARLFGSYGISAALRVEARLENLFGKRYEDVFGFPALGRRLTAGLAVRTGR